MIDDVETAISLEQSVLMDGHPQYSTLYGYHSFYTVKLQYCDGNVVVVVVVVVVAVVVVAVVSLTKKNCTTQTNMKRSFHHTPTGDH
jgi:hypothetical protein